VTVTERDWVQLEADWHTNGVTVRRIYPQSAHEIFIAVRHPDGDRMLTIQVSTHAAADVLRRIRALPRTRGLEMQFTGLGNDNGELRVILTDINLQEVFSPLVSDIAAAANAEPSVTDAVLAAVSRFEHWRQLLQDLAVSGLTPQSRRGLCGELFFLRDQLLTTLPADEAVRSWTGPTGAHQDFQLPSAAVEIKTSSGKQPQTLMISSERELDDTGSGRLILAYYSLDERRGGSGESLNAVVDRTRDLITGMATRETLDDLLVRVGYLRHHRDQYDEPRYTVRKQRFWDVTGDFPRITEADLRPGVGDCEYRISIAGLEQYVLTTEDVLSTVMEGSPR
jgi:hypothetical protein